jgi:hypothetical protein
MNRMLVAKSLIHNLVGGAKSGHSDDLQLLAPAEPPMQLCDSYGLAVVSQLSRNCEMQRSDSDAG